VSADRDVLVAQRDLAVLDERTLADAPRTGRSGRGLARVIGVVGPPLLTVALFIGLFESIHRIELFHPLLWPSPFSVVETMWNQAFTEHMWANLWITVQEALWGFLFGSVTGFVFGVGIALSRRFAQALYPYVVLVQSMPRIALAPVFAALFGFGMVSKVITAFAVCFFPVLINTIVGLKSVDEDQVSLMRSLCASRFQVFVRLRFPSSLPLLFAGLRTSMTLAFIGAVVGELTAGQSGMGELIDQAAMQVRMPAVFGYIMWLALTSLAFFLLLGAIGKRVAFWAESGADSITASGARPRSTLGA